MIPNLVQTYLPPLPHASGLFIFGLLLAWSAGIVFGRMKLRRGMPTNYTRKLFHFTIFTVATIIHASAGLPWVNAYAAGVILVVLLGVWRGDGHPLYETLARESDAPHRTFFILVPLATTALGGMASNWAAGDYALVGYLVTGWGDAVGEPIGRWLGRHPYRVPTLMGVPCTRTIEGSTAVGVAAFLAATLTLALVFDRSIGTAIIQGLAIALVTVMIEAVSPHGSDNFTTMVGAAVLARLMN